MSRHLMVIGMSTVVALVVALVGPGCGEGSTATAQVSSAEDESQEGGSAAEWARNNPPGRTQAQEHPVVKDNAHPRVPPAEREAMGLPAPTWVEARGKVQPAVREALQEQAELMERGDPLVEFQGDRPVGFQGMAYVDVYVRHEAQGKHTSKENRAAIRQVQGRLLSRLTAGEFSLYFAFKNTAGLVGYVNEAGLAKLIADADVVAIGLDDQPRPEEPPRVRHEPPPPRKRGEKGVVQAPVEWIGKVEAAVYETLKKSADGYVYVIVSATSVEWEAVGFQKGNKLRQRMHDRVLSALSAREFKLRGRSASLLDGYVNAAGLDKLDKHPDVSGVDLPGPLIQVPKIPKHW